MILGEDILHLEFASTYLDSTLFVLEQLRNEQIQVSASRRKTRGSSSMTPLGAPRSAPDRPSGHRSALRSAPVRSAPLRNRPNAPENKKAGKAGLGFGAARGPIETKRKSPRILRGLFRDYLKRMKRGGRDSNPRPPA